MRISSAFLANSAEVQNSLAYVLGGFPEWWTVESLPADANLAFVFVVEMDATELGQQFQFILRLSHPQQSADTLAVVQYSRPGEGQPAGTPIQQVISVTVRPQFKMEGLHIFGLNYIEDVVASVPLYVRLTPGQ